MCSASAAAGGLKALANHGPVSLEAHSDSLQLRADKDATITSTRERIEVLAKDRITLQVGASTITLDGANLTLACPGNLTVKTGSHQWLGGTSQAAMATHLPQGLVSLSPQQNGISAGAPGAGARQTISMPVLPVAKNAKYDPDFTATWGNTGVPGRGIHMSVPRFHLEIDSDTFKTFAFNTHIPSYLDAGLADLPLSDLIRIGTAPNIEEWKDKEMWQQVLASGQEVVKEKSYDSAVALVEAAKNNRLGAETQRDAVTTMLMERTLQWPMKKFR